MIYSKEFQCRHNKIKKPKIKNNRKSPRLRDRGRVRHEVYQEAYERAGGRCERCGWVDGSYDPSGQKWRLEAAHVVRRRHLNETTADDLIMLCGPSTNSGTCHHFADYTRSGRGWMLEHQKKRRIGA
jgi:hypothetical protein